MKYENLDSVIRISNSIKKIDGKMERLNHPLILTISPEADKYSPIETIGVFGNCEHDYYPLAKNFVDGIFQELANERAALSVELEKL